MRIGAGLLGHISGASGFSRLRQAALACEDGGMDSFWVADQRWMRDVYVSLADLAALTDRLLLGTRVTDPYVRHPGLTAVAIASLDEASGGRAVLGIGAGGSGFASMGLSRTRPAVAVREAIELIRQLWSGAEAEYHGRVVNWEHGALEFECRHDIPIVVAARGPRLLEVAGEIADGAIVASGVSLGGVEWARERVRAGEARGHRARDSTELLHMTYISLDRDRDRARQVVKQGIAGAVISPRQLGQRRHGMVSSLRADTLVVGGSLAALRAAYEARGAGASVVVAVKGKAGRSGSSAMTSAGYSTARAEGDSAELHYHDTMEGGRGLNDPELVRVMVEEAPARLDELVALGAPLVLDEDGRQAVSPSGDHSRPRTYGAANHTGRDFTEPLTRAVVERGARLLEMTAVVEVLTSGGEVVGAVGLDYREGSVVRIATPCVILGTGGAGRLFEVTSNPNDATGDGYALAMRAGAQVRDMEFIQFYPWRCIIPFDRSRMPIQPSTFVLGGRLYNSEAQRFMVGYDPVRKEASTRDLAARAIYEQIHQGKGVRSGVQLDVSALSLEEWTRSNPRPARHFLERNLDFREEQMILAPEAHFFMGGVVVDVHGQSRVPGLFAVGEVAGGVHGANRLDSNAIPETQVFGARAGRAAAQRAAAGVGPPIDHGAGGYDRLVAAGPRPGGSIYVELRRELQRVMWEQLGIIREGREMAIGLTEVAQLERRLSELEPASIGDMVQHETLANSLLVARCCFTAAQARRESRGAHYRRDFPDPDDAHWRFPLLLELRVDGSLTESPGRVGAGARWAS